MRVSVDGFVASSGFGGFISYIGGLCQALAARDDVELHIVAPSQQTLPEFGDLPSAAQVHRVVLSTVEGVRPGVTWTDEVLPRALDEIRPDVHLGPAFMLPPGHVRPQAVTVHDDMFERFPQFYGDATRGYLREQTVRALSVADVVLAVSASTRRDVLEHWRPEAPVAVTALAPRLVGAGAPSRPLNPPYLLNVGGSHRRKRLDVLIDAFSLAAADDRIPEETQLVIVGARDDDHVEDLRAASTVADRIQLTPRIPDAELPTWYAHAELFVYPSEYEGFGLGPLEAMASGAPVLTYRNSALAEVLDEAAEYADPGAPALAESISGLLADPERRVRMSERGIARAGTFDWSRTAEATMLELRTAIGRFTGTRR